MIKGKWGNLDLVLLCLAALCLLYGIALNGCVPEEGSPTPTPEPTKTVNDCMRDCIHFKSTWGFVIDMGPECEPCQ